MHAIVGPAEFTATVCDVESGVPPNVGEVTVADSANVPSWANRNSASDGDGMPGAEAYAYATSSTRLPNRSCASATSVTCSSIVYKLRSGSTVATSELGRAGTTTRTSSSTSVTPMTTHETSYSPATVAVIESPV